MKSRLCVTSCPLYILDDLQRVFTRCCKVLRQTSEARERFYRLLDYRVASFPGGLPRKTPTQAAGKKLFMSAYQLLACRLLVVPPNLKDRQVFIMEVLSRLIDAVSVEHDGYYRRVRAQKSLRAGLCVVEEGVLDLSEDCS